MKLLILTCDRLESLKTVVESAFEVFPITQMYIYVDKFYDLESNKKQKELLKYVNSIEGAIVQVSKENNGCSASMLKALDWIGETETEWLVLEDDVQLLPSAFEYFTGLELDRSKSFLVRFGEYFWGWYINKLAIEEIKTFDLLNVTDDEYILKHSGKMYFKHLNHFKLEKEAIKRRISTAWDNIFIVSSMFLEIATFTPKEFHTINIGKESTRIRRNNILGQEFDAGKIVMINGVIQ